MVEVMRSCDCFRTLGGPEVTSFLIINSHRGGAQYEAMRAILQEEAGLYENRS
jgi:hypothetical protein